MKDNNQIRLLLNRNRILLFLVFPQLLFTSCYQEPFNIDLSEFDNNIVIEGSITDQSGPYSVKISQTVKNNTPQDIFPPVSGAIVTIEDNHGNFERLAETDEGLYQSSSLQGMPGRTYTLNVTANGKKYTASSTMPQPLSILTLDIKYIDGDIDFYELSCSFRDREGIKDYCLINIYSNGYLIDFYLYQDNFTDGQEIIIDNFDVWFNINDMVTVELLTLDRSMYDFYNTFYMITDGEEDGEDDDGIGSTFVPVTTYNPTTNLNNGALGYFGANSIRRYTRRID